MKIFLTGSTGLLGLNTVEEALSRGHEVMALARDADKAKRVLPADSRVEVVVGDLENAGLWLPRIEEADALVHCAAYFREYFGRGEHDAKLRVFNVELPLELVRAAEQFGLGRSVMISSSGVVEARADGRPSSEEDPATGAVPENGYFLSKVEMESQLLSLAPTLHHKLIVVRPGWMFGPNDHAPTSAGQLVRDLLQSGSLQLPTGPVTCTVDARDVATGILAALEAPSPSSLYNIAGHPLVPVEALREVARQAGGGKVKPVPARMALMLSALLEAPSRWRGVPNPIPRIGVLTLSRGVNISSEKARRELGLSFRPFSETARDTVVFHRGALSKKNGK